MEKKNQMIKANQASKEKLDFLDIFMLFLTATKICQDASVFLAFCCNFIFNVHICGSVSSRSDTKRL